MLEQHLRVQRVEFLKKRSSICEKACSYASPAKGHIDNMRILSIRVSLATPFLTSPDACAISCWRHKREEEKKKTKREEVKEGGERRGKKERKGVSTIV